MAIKLVTKSGNINLTTGGVPQSEINGLLQEQEERLNKEHEYEIELITEAHEEVVNDLNTTIDSLEAENDELEEEVADLKEVVGNMPTPVEGVEF